MREHLSRVILGAPAVLVSRDALAPRRCRPGVAGRRGLQPRPAHRHAVAGSVRACHGEPARLSRPAGEPDTEPGVQAGRRAAELGRGAPRRVARAGLLVAARGAALVGATAGGDRARLVHELGRLPSLAALSDGTLVAHWLQKAGGGSYDYDVRLSRSTDQGLTWSPSVRPHRATPGEHGFVSLLPRPGGRLDVIWLDGRGMKDGAGQTALMRATFGLTSSPARRPPSTRAPATAARPPPWRWASRRWWPTGIGARASCATSRSCASPPTGSIHRRTSRARAGR